MRGGDTRAGGTHPSRRLRNGTLATVCALALVGACGSPAAEAAGSPLKWGGPISIDSPGTEIPAISCPAVTLCVAADGKGKIITSSEPAGGPGAWHAVDVTHEIGGFRSISCPSSEFCAAVDTLGKVWTSTNPTGGGGAWSEADVAGGSSVGSHPGISCVSGMLCVLAPDRRIKTVSMVEAEGDIFSSTDPPVAGSWEDAIGVDGPTEDVDGVACVSPTLCVATDDHGAVLTSEEPTGGVGAWSRQGVDEEVPLLSVSCASSILCATTDAEGDVVTSSDPAGIGGWNVARVDGTFALLGISCPSPSLCVAVDDQGDAVASAEPLVGAGAWNVTRIVEAGDFLDAVSCPSEALCVAADGSGNVVVGTAAVHHTLNVSLAGSGSGTVTGAGISCPASCSASYAAGSEVTLAATAATGSTFAGWAGGGCSGTGSCTVAMSVDRDVSATFESRSPGTGGSEGEGGSGNRGPGGGGKPTAHLVVSSPRPGGPLVFDGSPTSGNGSRIVGYTLRTSSSPEAVSCGPGSPIVNVNFAGPTAGTATLDVLTASGVTSTASVPYSTSGPTLAKRARASAIDYLARQPIVSAQCDPSPGSAPPPSLSVGGRAVNPACEVVAGLVDAVGCGLHQVQLCSQVPTAERTLLEGHQDRFSGCLPGRELLGTFARARSAAGKTIGSCAFHCAPLVDTYYLSTEPIRVNGLDIVPEHGSAIVIAVGGLYSTQFTSRHAAYLVSGAADVELGKLPLILDAKLDYTVGGGVSSAHIADFDIRHPLPFLPEFSDLPLVGTLSADLVPGGATELAANVELPGVFTDEEGNGLTTSLALRTDNPGGLQLDSFHLSVPDADLGEVAVENASLDYSRKGQTLEGKASVLLPSGDTASAEVGFLRGTFDKFVFDYAFGPGEGIEVFDGIYLTELFGGLRVDPTELEGGSRVSIGPSVTDQGCGVVDVRGNLTVHFGPLPFSIGGTGENELLCEKVGTRYFHVDSDGHAEIGESIDFSIPSPDTGEEPPLAKVSGDLKGQAYTDLRSRRFHFQFDGVENAALNVFGLSGSYQAELVVSDLGFGVCAEVDGPLGSKWHPGFGEDFAKVDPGVLISPPPIALALLVKNLDFELESCNIAQYRTLSGAATARAGRARTAVSGFTVPPGERTAILALHGSGGAPLVVLHGPGGRVIDGSHPAPLVGADELVLHAPSEDLTEIQIRGRDAGAWTIEAAKGSPAITEVAVSHELPPPRIRARVTGRGARRVLHYRARVAPGTRITFLEQGSGGSTVIGTARGSHGAITFTPSLARPGKREILAALLSAGGTPEPSIAVGSYTAAPPHPGRPGRPRIRRRGSALLIGFGPAPLASSHLVTVHLSDGRRLLFVLKGRRHSLVVRSVAKKVRVLGVRVRGEGFGVLGPASHG